MEEVYIKKYNLTGDDQDYDFLRKAGLDHIKSIAGKVWTDHNIHDPGITFLEVLCYAITDLGYRISTPIKDLLTKENQSQEALLQAFPTAKNILTTKPISEFDYRKLFIDIEGVKNAFIKADTSTKVYTHCLTKVEPSEDDQQGVLSYSAVLPDYQKQNEFILKGLNKIFFEPDVEISLIEDEVERNLRIAEITKEIKDKYHANRNLCEDLYDVCEVEDYEINVCGNIEIERTARPAEVLAEIFFRIQEHLSPSVKRNRLEDLLDEGLQPESIFNGPILNNGFITDDDLALADFKTEVRLSDLIKIVSETPGVKKIQKLSMNTCPCNDEMLLDDCPPLENKWKICFPQGFDKVLRLCTDNSIINVFKDVIPIDFDRSEVVELFAQKVMDFNQSLNLSYDDLEIPQGDFMNVGQYFSVQNDLPNIYGVGEDGLSDRLPVKRHAQALQLKAYLTFFDQILATYFSHLQNVGDLLSHQVSGNQSYFTGQLDSVKRLDKILKNPAIVSSEVQDYLMELDDFVERKGRFLDHLLARFAENMNDYVFLMNDLFGIETEDASLFHKAKLLSEYVDISYQRACAFNYSGTSHGVWDTLNVSGFQHRIARLLGIRDYSRRNLTSYSYEFYEELDDDGISELRWRVRHTDGFIMFSSSMHYHSIEEAEDEMWKTVTLAWDIGNYEIRPTEEGDKWHFVLLDKSKEVVARHIQYYTDKSEVESTIEAYADFMFNKVTDEGFYLFENILLRPDKDDPNATDKFKKICMDQDCEQCAPHDPYSFRMTIVLPGWTKRFSNLYFRAFAEKLIREEAPAHIVTRICWIGSPLSGEDETDQSQMSELEELYQEWLTKKMETPEDQTGNDCLKPLVDLLHDLNTIYPQGTLHDCDSPNAAGSAIILNQSSLGELKNSDDDNE